MNASTDTAAQIGLRLAALDNERDAATHVLEVAQAEYGDALLGADPDKTARAAERVQERQQDLPRLLAAREALQRRLVAAREREAVAANAAKWDAFAEALEHRHAAFAAAEKLAGPFFAAVEVAIAASTTVDKLAPVEKVLSPDGWHLMPTVFAGMANMKSEELATVKAALQDMTKKSRTYGALAMRMREFDKPGEKPVTQYAGPRRERLTVEPTPIVEA